MDDGSQIYTPGFGLDYVTQSSLFSNKCSQKQKRNETAKPTWVNWTDQVLTRHINTQNVEVYTYITDEISATYLNPQSV